MCVCVCMQGYKHASIHICKYVCILHAYMYAGYCMYVSMYVCVHAYMYIFMMEDTQDTALCMCMHR